MIWEHNKGVQQGFNSLFGGGGGGGKGGGSDLRLRFFDFLGGT